MLLNPFERIKMHIEFEKNYKAMGVLETKMNKLDGIMDLFYAESKKT